jgi:hypothetical protein
MEDDAPNVSTDCSFLLESSVLERNRSVSPGTPGQSSCHPQFAVSNFGEQGPPHVPDDDSESFLLPRDRPRPQPSGLFTPQQKQEISNSLHMWSLAAGARTCREGGGSVRLQLFWLHAKIISRHEVDVFYLV